MCQRKTDMVTEDAYKKYGVQEADKMHDIENVAHM